MTSLAALMLLGSQVLAQELVMGDPLIERSRAVIEHLVGELAREGWKSQAEANIDTWRLAGPASLDAPIAVIRLVPGKSQAVVYVLAPAKVPPLLRPAAMAWMARVNHRLFEANFELDPADGELRCRAGLDYQNTALDQASLNAVFHAALGSWRLYRGPFSLLAGDSAAGNRETPPKDRPVRTVTTPAEKERGPAEPRPALEAQELFAAIAWPATALPEPGWWRCFYRSSRGTVQLLVGFPAARRHAIIQAYPVMEDRAGLALPDAAMAESDAWLARQNFGLRIGYFTLDPSSRIIAFRVVVPLEAGSELATRFKTALLDASLSVLRYGQERPEQTPNQGD